MDYLMLVDSVNAVPQDYSPSFEEVGRVRLECTAAFYCRKMLDAALEDGVEIKPLSGWRSVEHQRRLWNLSVAEYLSDGLTLEECERLTSRFLAKPFHSEHHTGLACDFCTPDWDDVQDDFYTLLQGKWLCSHAARFGFILRYPRMKEHITGIAYEPWHYRYVGKPHAEIIRSGGLTLEEYLYYYDISTR